MPNDGANSPWVTALRGIRFSLLAIGLILVLELAYLVASQGILSILKASELLELGVYYAGAAGLFGLALAFADNALLAILAYVEQRARPTKVRGALLAVTGAVLWSPIAYVMNDFFGKTVGHLLAVSSTLLPVALGYKLGTWPALTRLVRPVHLLGYSILAADRMVRLVSAHQLGQRLNAPDYAALAAGYGLFVVASGWTLALLMHWIAGAKTTPPTPSPGGTARLRAWAATCCALAMTCGAYAVDLVVFPGLYPEFHLYLKCLLYVFAQASVLLAVASLRTGAQKTPGPAPGDERSDVASSTTNAGRGPGPGMPRSASGAPVPVSTKERDNPEVLNKTAQRVLWSALGLAAAGSAAFGLFRFDNASQASAIALTRAPVLGSVIRIQRSVLDFDGDGQSPLWGGADCDDRNHRVRAGQPEIPDNGIDDNCFAGDLTEQRIAEHRASLRQKQEERTAWWMQQANNPRRAFNIVLVSIDSLRRAHVGHWGYPRDTTPHIDRLARSALVFKHAYCSGGFTSLSVPSLLKGLLPTELAYRTVVEDPSWRLWFPESMPPDTEVRKVFTVAANDRNEALAQTLKNVGYSTAAVLNDGETDYFRPHFGYIHGFDAYCTNDSDKLGTERILVDAGYLTRIAIDALDTVLADKPFFLWVHHFDPHAPYRLTPDSRWGARPVDRYDGEVAWTDRHVGALLDALDERGLRDDTIVVVTADHGEAFGEHGLNYHGLSSYEEEIGVPLLLYVPTFGHRDVLETVSLVDLVPTLLDLVGVRSPHTYSGRSLLPAVFADATEGEGSAVSVTWRYSLKGVRITSVKTLVRGRYKLVYDDVNEQFFLYDLHADPTERVNVADAHPARFVEMRNELLAVAEREAGTRAWLQKQASGLGR